MAKRRKNLGKVKRYRRSFYSGPQRAKRIAGGAVLLAALFLAGWLIGPAVIDFGTSTWYRLKRGGEPAPSSQPAETPAPQATASPEPTPQATPQPMQAVGEGGWAFVGITGVRDAAAAAATAQQLAQQGIKYAVLPLKDSQGYVYYPSGAPAAQGSIAATTFDAAAAAAALRDAGITPVASICAFRDPIAPNANRTMAMRYQDTDYFWLDAARDAGGKPWLNPYSEEAVGYIGALIAEARGMGYEQIWLTGVQFPGVAGRDKANFGDTGGLSMGERLAQVISTWQEGGVCWVEYPLEVAAAGAESQVLGASPAELGVKNLALRADTALSEEDSDRLAETVRAAKEGGVSNVAVVQGDTFALQ